MRNLRSRRAVVTAVAAVFSAALAVTSPAVAQQARTIIDAETMLKVRTNEAIDIKAADGLTTTELADYAAMRTFAATDPERVVSTGVPTILSVLGQPDDKPMPVTLTYWDLGLLKALYSTDNAYYARYQRGDMERVVREELERSGAADRN